MKMDRQSRSHVRCFPQSGTWPRAGVLLLIVVLALMQVGTALAAPPANDDFDNRQVIPPAALPETHIITDTKDTTEATVELGEIVNTCSTSIPHNSIWYEFTPSESAFYAISTAGSNYDTILTIGTSSSGILECNDDTFSGTAASIGRVLDAGTTYYIRVTSKFVGGGTISTLNVDVSGGYLLAGGPYTISEGESLTMTASPGAPNYSWDVNGDGTFGDATGENPTLTWDQLVALGINDGPNTFNVKVRTTVDVVTPALVITSSATTLTVNNTAPDLTAPSDQTAVEDVATDFSLGSFADPGVEGSWTVTVDWGDGSTATVFPVTTAGSLGTQSHTYVQPGSYTVTVTVDDGEITDTATFGVTVSDVTDPETTIDSNPANPTNSTTATFTFSGTDNVAVTSFECSLDGALFATCTSGETYNNLTDGSHVFEVRAIDAAGNVDETPASYTWLVDTIAPTLVVPTPITVDATSPSGAVVTYDVSATDSQGGSGVASAICNPPSGSTFPVGTTTVTCTATDNAGNQTVQDVYRHGSRELLIYLTNFGPRPVHIGRQRAVT